MKQKKNLTWKLKDLPTASELADLVRAGVISPEEAREIVLGNAESDKDKVEALEKMIEFLQGLVKQMADNRNTLQYTTPIYIERRVQPYFDKVWMSTSKSLKNTGLNFSTMKTTTTGNVQNNSTYFTAQSLPTEGGIVQSGYSQVMSVNMVKPEKN